MLGVERAMVELPRPKPVVLSHSCDFAAACRQRYQFLHAIERLKRVVLHLPLFRLKVRVAGKAPPADVCPHENIHIINFFLYMTDTRACTLKTS